MIRASLTDLSMIRIRLRLTTHRVEADVAGSETGLDVEE